MVDASIWRFILFIFVEFLYIASSAIAIALFLKFIRKQKKIENRYQSIFQITSELVAFLFLFLFILVLTGEGFYWLFAVLIVVTISMILLVDIIWLMFGTQDVPWASRTVWINLEINIRAPALTLANQIISFLIFITFSVYIGYGYFGEPMPEAQWVKFVLRTTVIFLLISAVLFVLPQRIYILASKNVMEGTRSRIFYMQLGQSASILLYIAIILWTLDGSGEKLELFGDNFVFSTNLAYAITFYLIVTLIFPYLAGHNRSRWWVSKLDQEHDKIADDLIEGLMNPNRNKQDHAINNAGTVVQTKMSESSQNTFFDMMNQQDIEIFNIVAPDAKSRDPRYLHYKKLELLSHIIDDCKTAINELDPKADRKDTLERCIAILDKQKTGTIQESSGTNPLILVAITAVVTALVNTMLSSLGKILATHWGLPT